MNFDASPLNIRSILSVKQRYIIPRNQREFSWEKLQLDEFWQDIIRNISFDDTAQLKFSEYFIGTIVLSGVDSDEVLEIVDGQQRLSVITMLLSIISRLLRKAGQEGIAEDIFTTYIVTISDAIDRNSLGEDGETYVEKIQKNSGRDYFKIKFQDRIDHSSKPACDEDRKLAYAGSFLQRKLQRKSLCSLILQKEGKYDKADHIYCLRALYRMITSYLKLVRISVDKGDDAYDIFEVLNARGINLTSLDLIKNKIFQNCTQTFPVDVARRKWDYIVKKIESRSESITITEYVRCWWLSKYNYIGEEQLYRAFKREMLDDDSSLTATDFLEQLYNDVDLYVKIISPEQGDWPQADQREIFDALNSLSIFNISIPRPYILSLLRKKRDKPRALKQSDLIDCLKRVENFHFKFSAICRQRPSGLDAKYSVFAVNVSNADNKRELSTRTKETNEYFQSKAPSDELFKSSFVNDIYYINSKTSQRKLIIYIFERIEMHLKGTRELKFDIVSLEHIGSQKNFIESNCGSIGNLLPLCFSINEDCKNNPLLLKLPEYKKSNLSIVSEFIDEIESTDNNWTKDKVDARSLALAKLMLESM